MARWRLKDRHYLNVPGTTYTYAETDQLTGRRAQKVYPVPLYLDPDIVTDHNYPGEIIVTNKQDNKYPRDIFFIGSPTPDMIPIDDEAEEITQSFIDRGAWIHPIDSLNMTYSQSMLSEFERAFSAALAEKVTMQAPPNISTGGASQKQLDELKQMVQQLAEQNANLQAQILERPKGFVRRA